MTNKKKENLNYKTPLKIKLSNARDVLEQLDRRRLTPKREEIFYTLVQGNTFSDVDVTEENINENSDFITDCWY